MRIRHSLSLLYEGRTKHYATEEILEGAFSRRNSSQDMSTQPTGSRKQGEKEEKMNKLIKRLLSAVIVLTISLSTMAVTFAKEAETIKVTITIERFTIGQGFFVEPVTVEVNEGASVKDALEKVAEEKELTFDMPSGYLNTISYADTGVINIPQSIQDMPAIDVDYGEYGKYHYDAPTNTSTNVLFEDNQKLGSGSYGDLAGWMYSLNNSESSNGMDAQPVNDGDVVRIQFSVYAAGADIGFTSWYENIESAKLANKDKLIKQVASVDAEGEYKDARAEAVKVLEQYDATQDEVDEALSALGYVEPTTPDETTVQETTTVAPTEAPTTQETTTFAKLGKVKIKKLTNVKKYRVKIKINKVRSAKGYQYRYATNKKFKKSKVKTTTKTTFTTKRLSKRVRCYVKVRAYRKNGKTRIFGRWSNVKSIKVKK